jgi:hypothetical protein
MTTGYFGVPGRYGGKVHLVDHMRPACGTSLSINSEYQWCSQGIEESMIECERCKVIARRLIEAQHAERLRRLAS